MVALRDARERALQTLCFEALGLLLVTPLYSLAAGSAMDDALGLLVLLSVVVMAWSALYNTAFDWAEARLAQRVASDRPAGLRVAHALGLEGSVLLATWPLIHYVGGLSWRDALIADIGLTLTYAAYAWAFHWAFDRLRPVRA